MTGLSRAIEVANGQAPLARLIGGNCRQGHVWKWINKQGGLPPADRCPRIEEVTGVRCEELRPDLEWLRDERGIATEYVTKVSPPSSEAA
jgi:DNA-binding transcriptional regulator YdaS (Cro superfamily)